MRRQRRPGEWEAKSACRNPWVDPAWFDENLDSFGDGEREKKEDRVERHKQAKKVCAGCPVIDKCREFTDIEYDSGIRFGELMEDLRKKNRAERERRRLNRIEEEREAREARGVA